MESVSSHVDLAVAHWKPKSPATLVRLHGTNMQHVESHLCAWTEYMCCQQIHRPGVAHTHCTGRPVRQGKEAGRPCKVAAGQFKSLSWPCKAWCVWICSKATSCCTGFAAAHFAADTVKPNFCDAVMRILVYVCQAPYQLSELCSYCKS